MYRPTLYLRTCTSRAAARNTGIQLIETGYVQNVALQVGWAECGEQELENTKGQLETHRRNCMEVAGRIGMLMVCRRPLL